MYYSSIIIGMSDNIFKSLTISIILFSLQIIFGTIIGMIFIKYFKI